MKVLITAFDPFGGEKINPAFEAVKLLPNEICGAEIVKVEVPTSFSRAFSVVKAEIDRENPNAVILVGQAGGRRAITPERVAINVDDARIPDNDGDMPREQRILANAPDAYFSTLPIVKIVDELNAANVPSEISNSAGTFVCNHLFYLVMDDLAKSGNKTIGGFVHVPFETSQAKDKPNTFALPIEEIAKGLKIVIETVIK